MLYERFINILGVTGRSPSPDALSELIRAHFSVIPFENISKLYYKKHFDQEQLHSFEQYLDGIEKYNFGGTCYSNNYYFFRLLVFLGYQAQLCSADMKSPGVHMVVRVSLENKEYLVDVGYAAPFIQAIPLHLSEDFTVINGRDQYVFKPKDKSGSTELVMFRNGSYKHGYTVRPDVRVLEDFNQVIAESFRPDSTFFRSLLITKLISGRFCTLHNMEYMEASGGETTIHTIGDLKELIYCIEDIYQIPAAITNQLLPGLDLTGDSWH